MATALSLGETALKLGLICSPDCPCIVFKLFHAECLRPFYRRLLYLGAAVGAAPGGQRTSFLSIIAQCLPESVLFCNRFLQTKME